MEQKVERAVSTKQYVYNQVAQDIITGVYSPDTIITESMLLRKYDVSRVSVREALIELCKDNYLRSIPRTGYMLVTYSLEEAINIIDFRAAIAEHWTANMNFHLALCSLSGNKYVYEVLSKLLYRNSSYFQYFYENVWDGHYSFEGKHKKIVTAVIERDLEKACDLLRSDINDVKNSLINRLK